MTEASTRHAVLNSLLFIRDPSLVDLPDIDGQGAVWATKSCIAVSCQPDSEGETTISLGIEQGETRTGTLVASRRISTPSREVIVENVLGEALLRLGVPTIATLVQIWTNGQRDTDIVAVRLSTAD